MPHPTLTPQSVLATFAAVDHACPYADAELIARIVTRHGVDGAVGQTGDDSAIRPKLLAYQAALAEIANPAALAERLRTDAEVARQRGEKAQREADEFRAKHARWGDDDYALRAAGCERTAVRNLAEARRLLKRANALAPVAA